MILDDLLIEDILENTMPHIPVLADEVIRYLSPKDGEIFIDGTFGAGGYTKAILKSSNCKVIALDRDPDVAEFAADVTKEFGSRFSFIQGNFADMLKLVPEYGVKQVDGVVLDLGVSSMQLDTAHRGFSFLYDAPLDMRMSRTGKDAKDFINNADEETIANVIYRYGEETDARKIARKIIAERNIKPITTTGELANIVRKAIGFRKTKIDLATKTFQAIRIWVNDELEALERVLVGVDKILKPGGRLVIVTFHSLEDSIVKDYMKQYSVKKVARSKYAATPAPAENELYDLITRKAIKPKTEEVLYNRRARSAKLRAAKKLDIKE